MGSCPLLTAGFVLCVEGLERLGLGLVNAEHRQEVRQLERLAHAVLRLEEDELRAEALGGLEALNELAEAVAVDVIHVGEVEEDLAIAFVEELGDQPGEHLVADADRQPPLEVDNDDVAFLSRLDIHRAGDHIRMNLVLLFEDDFVADGRAALRGRRLKHVTNVHRAAVGDELTVGGAGARGCPAIAWESLELEVALDRDPPPPIGIALVLALPRPIVLNRVIASATSMGIKRIELINTWRVEKSYWSSPRSAPGSGAAPRSCRRSRSTASSAPSPRRRCRSSRAAAAPSPPTRPRARPA